MAFYTLKQLASGLIDTAQGTTYDGKALREAYDLETLTSNDRDCIARYMHGAETLRDRLRLIDIANYITSKII